jgi:threonine/homoserine/homoserine lactone efflux protein
MYLEVVLQGISMGFILSLLIGPVFFLLMETSIRDGFKAALFLDLGVFLSDVFFISLVYVFSKEILSLSEYENTLLIIAGITFVAFGIYNAKKNTAKRLNNEMLSAEKNKIYFRYFAKGFILNAINPSVVFYWFGVLILGQINNQYKGPELFIFFASILVSFFGIDILKIMGAGLLNKKITPTTMKKINLFTGTVLMIFGIVMIVKGINGYIHFL